MSRSLADRIVITIDPMAETVNVDEIAMGVTRTKAVLPDDLVACFEKSIKEPKRITSGFLPENCLSVSVTAGTKSFVIRHPALRADITYMKTVYEGFPLPRLVFGFDISRDGRVTKCRMAVVADEKPSPDTPLFTYPFSNVYADDGICVGAANSLPVYKNTRALSSLPHLILALPNNDHLFSRANNRLKLGHRELLEHLADKEPSYYYEYVLTPKKGRTLNHFINENTGRTL
jgi:hypothetical protein